MDPSRLPNLKFLHSEITLNRLKLELFQRLSTEELKSSLVPGKGGSLKVRPDGTVLDGHHRIHVLVERGEDIHQLPRTSMRATLSLLRGIAAALEDGKNVAVHCRQSIGRSGLIVASLLVVSGMAVEKGIEIVSAARGQAFRRLLHSLNGFIICLPSIWL